jgi:hypothetical protein
MIATCPNCARILLPEDKEDGYCSDRKGCESSRKTKIAYTRERQAQGYVS